MSRHQQSDLPWVYRNQSSVDQFVRHGGAEPEIYPTELAVKNALLERDLNFINLFPHYHHGIIPFTSQPFKNVTRLPPGHEVSRDGKVVREHSESSIPSWNEKDNPDIAAEFFETLSAVINEKNAHAILFSGGIDSLIIAILDQQKRPLITANLDPLQTAIAVRLAELLNREHIVVEPSSSNEDRAIRIDNLRKSSLGHYCEWNSGIIGFSEFHDKKFMSGQHADTLLMVDTFAPGIHMHGIFRFLSTCRSIPDRFQVSPLSYFLSPQWLYEKDVNRRIASFDEHSALFAESKPTKFLLNEILLELANTQVSSHQERLKLLKEVKQFQFILNANFMYQVQSQYLGVDRELVYFDKRVRDYLISYCPTVSDLAVPKSLFYNFLKSKGLDYFAEKKAICSRAINYSYFLRRVKKRRLFENHSFALECLMRNASEIGFSSSEEFLRYTKDIGLPSDLTKRNIMKLDRYLNLRLFLGS